MIKLKSRKVQEVFSIRKNKENPFNSLRDLLVHKNRNLLVIKEKRQEWGDEYYLIYNSFDIDNN